MIDLSEKDQCAYDALYRNCPATQTGRIKRALLLIRRGWCDSRAYDDCFEMGDGGAVLAGVLRHIKFKEPLLRRAMINQGTWSKDYDAIMGHLSPRACEITFEPDPNQQSFLF